MNHNSIQKLIEQIQQEDRPLNFSESADYLNVSKSTLYKMTSKSKIAHFKPNGKKIYFKKSDLNKYLLRNKRLSEQEIEQKAIDYVTQGGSI